MNNEQKQPIEEGKNEKDRKKNQQRIDSITDPKKEESSEKPDNMIGVSGGLAASMDADLS